MLPMQTIRSALFLAVVLSCASACQRERSGPGGATLDGGGSATPATDGGPGPGVAGCMATCEAKGTTCGAAAEVAAFCPGLCEQLTSAAQVSCLNATSCDALGEAIGRGEIPCLTPSGPAVDAGATGGPRDSGTGGSSGACDPRDPARCDGNVVVTCEEVAGVPATVRRTCSTFATCERGECVEDTSCLAFDERDCSSSSIGPNRCCDGLTCFGEIGSGGDRYQRCCVPSGGTCDRHTDCCGFSQAIFDIDPRGTPGCHGLVCGYP